MPILGKVSHDGRFTYEWRIEDFLSFNYVRSPTFFFKDTELFMEVSVFHDKDEDRLQIAICNADIRSRKPSLDFHVDLSMNTGSDGNREHRSGTLGCSGNLRFFRWMPWTEMLHRRLRILGPNGVLTIFCSVQKIKRTVSHPIPILSPSKPEIGIDEDKSKQVISQTDENGESDENFAEEAYAQSKGVKNLLKALRDMLMTGEDSDVIVNVRGKEFRAHKGILRARSPVFSSMFSHDMLEKNSNVVDIDDCDPETFPDFLDHIYTGSTSMISKKNVFSLYRASDKYDIGDLKEECVEYMKENMAVDSFCNVITLAMKHDEKELIEMATEFFCINSLNIIKTVEWQTFLNENATAGNELFIKLLSK